MIKLIQRIGFFRLLQVPLGIVIMVTAYSHQIIGMGVVGLIILIFGVLNKCLISGKCETNFDK